MAADLTPKASASFAKAEPRTGGGRGRFHLVLNVTTVVFLALVLVGFVAMPRYNYGHIVSRVARLEGTAAGLESGFEKVNILAGGDEFKRAAVVAKIDFIVEKMKGHEMNLTSFMEHLAAAEARLEDFARRLGAIEGPSDKAAAEVSRGERPWNPGRPQPPDPDRLAKDLGGSARVIAQMGFEEFLGRVAERGLVKLDRQAPVQDQVPEEKFSRLRSLFSSFKAAVEFINSNEYLSLESLVEEATRKGEYIEDGEGPGGPETVEKGRTVYWKFLGNGKKREFHFSEAENPAAVRFEELRAGALRSLLVAVPEG